MMNSLAYGICKFASKGAGLTAEKLSKQSSSLENRVKASLYVYGGFNPVKPGWDHPKSTMEGARIYISLYSVEAQIRRMHLAYLINGYVQ